MSVIALAVVATCLLSFANGANDNSKGVATLVGGRTMALYPSLIYAAVATFLGSAAAILLAGTLAAKFSGKGLVDAELLESGVFFGCVGFAAAATVLLATRAGMPVSTTHALVGGIAGVGWSARALHVPALATAFFIPLLIAPVLALVIAAVVYPVLRAARLRLGITRHTCVCVEREIHSVSIMPGAAALRASRPAVEALESRAADTIVSPGALIGAPAGLKLSPHRHVAECFERYDGQVIGIDAQRVLNWSHILTAGAISFARGLNDTPKIAGLLIAASGMTRGWGMVAVGAGIALGGLLAARRVAETISHRITGMNDGQAFTANLVTAALVIFASRLGVPVSTTHVSCGGLFGIGLVNRKAHWKVIGQITLAWVTTLPVAGGIGWIAWRVLV